MSHNRVPLVLTSLLTLAVVTAGCRNDERVISKILADKFKDLPARTEERLREVSEGKEEICKLFDRLPPNRKRDFIATLTTCFRRLEFDGRSYTTRGSALSDYIHIAFELTDHFRLAGGVQEDAWRFRLDALDRVNEEIRRCESEPAGGLRGMNEIDPSMSKQQYLEYLKVIRWEFIWTGFEMSPFSLYFKSLPPKEKTEWENRLRDVAKKELLICNSNNPSVKIPFGIYTEDSGIYGRTVSNDQVIIQLKDRVIKMKLTEEGKKYEEEKKKIQERKKRLER